MNFDDEDRLMMLALLGAGATVLSLDITHKPDCPRERTGECSCELGLVEVTADDLSNGEAS